MLRSEEFGDLCVECKSEKSLDSRCPHICVACENQAYCLHVCFNCKFKDLIIFNPMNPIDSNKGPNFSSMYDYRRENKIVTNAGIFNHYSSYNSISLGPIPPPRKLKRKIT